VKYYCLSLHYKGIDSEKTTLDEVVDGKRIGVGNMKFEQQIRTHNGQAIHNDGSIKGDSTL